MNQPSLHCRLHIQISVCSISCAGNARTSEKLRKNNLVARYMPAKFANRKIAIVFGIYYFSSIFQKFYVIPSIWEACNLHHHFQHWLHSSIFPTYAGWKKLMKTKTYKNEIRQWTQHCHGHPRTHFARICLENVTLHCFRTL